MRYIDINWHHDADEEPYRLVSEIGADGLEKRKLEFFRNGTVGFASELVSSDSTMLGVGKIPALEIIVAQPDFSGRAISKEEFEQLWLEHAREY